MIADHRIRLDALIRHCAGCGGWVFGMNLCPPCVQLTYAQRKDAA